MLRSLLYISGLILLCFNLQLGAQANLNGVPIITNYPYDITGGTEQNYCITQDLRGVLYVGNYNVGILEYDGVNWRVIPVYNDAPVRSIVTGDDGVVYAGLDGDLGRLAPDSTGNLYYESLLNGMQRAHYQDISVWRCFYSNGKAYFCSISEVFIFNPAEQNLEIITLPGESYFSYVIDNNLYIADIYNNGLMVYSDSTFEQVPGGSYYAGMNITGMEKYRENQVLISTYFYGISILDLKTGEINDNFLGPDLKQELSEAMLTCMRVDKDQILVGTYFNGIYILDLEGEVKQIISKSEELFDKTITWIYSNSNIKAGGPLWIAHWKGISKLETNNPFSKFTEASGFEGLITDVAEFGGNLYISTLSGLYVRQSDETGTRFVPIEKIRGETHKLLVVNPSRNTSFLLVNTRQETYILRRNGMIEALSERIVPMEGQANEGFFLGGRNLIADPKNPGRIFTRNQDQILGLEYYRGKWKVFFQFGGITEDIRSMAIDRFDYLWFTTPGSIKRLDITLSNDPELRTYGEIAGLPSGAGNMVYAIPKSLDLKIGTRNGIYEFDYFEDSFHPDSALNAALPGGLNQIRVLYVDKDGDYWLSFHNESRKWSELLLRKSAGKFEILSEKPFQRLSSAALTDVFRDDTGNGVWFSKSDMLYYYDKSFSRSDSLVFSTLIRRVTLNGDSVLFNGTNYEGSPTTGFRIHKSQEQLLVPDLHHKYNNLEFQWSAPFFEQEERLTYSFILEGFDPHWSSWSNLPNQTFTNLKHGRYTLRVKARNVYDYESAPASYSFIIRRPWYSSILAIIFYIILGGLFIYLVIKLYTRRLTRENIRLEGIIQDRTAEIRKQKEELTDSIEYASRIQRALLPSNELMRKHELEHFILFRPRDIVSGDFYWLGEKEGNLVIVAADCTGHGVPGAFMSMLGMTFLDEIVINSGITDTGRILDSLRGHVISALEQSNEESHDAVKDGMDLAMLSLDLDNGDVQYSGAYNPLYMVRKMNPEEKKLIDRGEELDLPRGSIHDEKHVLIQVRADQMPIGISEKEHEFSSTRIRDEGYSYYMFSDGFLDQFGGSKGKKFMSRNFKKLLLEMQKYPMGEQGTAMEKVLLDWMGDISQIDDILVMGIRLQSN